MFRRKREPPGPVPAISHDEVLDIFKALADIKSMVIDVLAILRDEEGDEEDNGA